MRSLSSCAILHVTRRGRHATPRARIDREPRPFAAFLDACGPLGLDIELKTDDTGLTTTDYVEVVAEALDAAAPTVPVMVTSFDQVMLDAFATR